MRPAIAFIIDIRRENRNLHLLYKSTVRDLDRSSRLRLASVLASAPGRSRIDSERRRDFQSGSRGVPPYERAVRGEFGPRPGPAPRGARLAAVPRPTSRDSIARSGHSAADGPDIQFWGTRTIHGVRPSYRWLHDRSEISRARAAASSPRRRTSGSSRSFKRRTLSCRWSATSAVPARSVAWATTFASMRTWFTPSTARMSACT